MGWNTTVVVMNDSLHTIAQDPQFGKKLAEAISGAQLPPEYRSRDVSACTYDAKGNVRGVDINAATVIETHHADGYAVVAVGGNNGVKLGECYYTGFPDNDESKLKVLKQLADDIGYNVVKKPTRK